MIAARLSNHWKLVFKTVQEFPLWCSGLGIQEIIILSEVSQTEKDKYHMISHMWNLKK